MAQVTKRGEGRWMVRVFLGRNDDGKRRFHSKMIHGTKKDADKYARKIQTQVDTGEYVGGKTAAGTVESFLASWLDETATLKVSDYTLTDYRAMVRRYINPVLGEMPLVDLRPGDVQRLVTTLEAKELSPRTIRYTQGVLRNALNKAVREGTIPSNPAGAKMVDLPKAENRELTVLDPEEARAFVQAAKGDRWSALWIMLIGTGARPGELLGLTWDDFDGKRIRIQRALVRDRKGGGWALKEPKTRKSRRTVPLPAPALDALKVHRRRQAEEKLAAETYATHRLIFADEVGEPLVWSELARNHFHDLLTEANLPKIRPYDLRHTCASLLLAEGINPKVVSERLGHSTITLTLDTYSAVLPGLQEKATERLGEVLTGGDR